MAPQRVLAAVASSAETKTKETQAAKSAMDVEKGEDKDKRQAPGGGEQGRKKHKTDRRRQRHRDSGTNRDKPIPAIDHATADMNQLMLKGMLNLFQRMRTVEGVIYKVWLLPADCKLTKAISAQGKNYADKCRQEGASHGLGPPHPYLVGGMLDIMLAEKSALGEILLKPIEEMSEKWDTMEMDERCDLMPHLQLSKCYDKEKMRLSIHLENLPVQVSKSMTMILGLMGGERKMGRAPASAFEDQLEMWLDSVMKVRS